MAKKTFGLTCACCGTDITAPQFYNNKAYGYTCILKVNPDAKRSKKDNGLWLDAEITINVEAQTITASVGGLSFKEKCFNAQSSYNIKNGLVRISEYRNGTKCVWKGTEIRQVRVGRQQTLKPVEIVGRNGVVVGL